MNEKEMAAEKRNENIPALAIDQQTVKRLMIAYRATLGTQGGSEISRQISDHTDFSFGRRALEKWLSTPNRGVNGTTLKAVISFMRTKIFQEAVPEARDLFDRDARLIRIGTALFNLHATPADPLELHNKHALLSGWWKAVKANYDHFDYLSIEPVAGHPFSKIVGSVVPHAFSGLVFFQQDLEFLILGWSKRSGHHELRHLIFVDGPKELAVRFTYLGSNREKLYEKPFSRVDQSAVPPSYVKELDEWKMDVIPKGTNETTT